METLCVSKSVLKNGSDHLRKGISTAKKCTKENDNRAKLYCSFAVPVAVDVIVGTLRSDNGNVHENVAEK